MENIVKQIVKEKQPFERLEVSKEDLLEMFKVIFKIFFIKTSVIDKFITQ